MGSKGEDATGLLLLLLLAIHFVCVFAAFFACWDGADNGAGVIVVLCVCVCVMLFVLRSDCLFFR